jgi:hypothetical protein
VVKAPAKTGTRAAQTGQAQDDHRLAQAAKAPETPPPAGLAPPAGPPAAADQALSGQKPWPGIPAPQTPPPVAAPTEPQKSDQPTPAETLKQWDEIVVPAESVLGLQLETPLSSEHSRVEDRVDARLTRDVRVEGRVAIPAGTHAVGAVTLVERGGKIKERARIGIRFTTLVLADATRISITTEAVYREGESPGNASSAKIGGAAIGGAIIGAILGGGKGAAIGSGLGAAGGAAAAMAGDRQSVVLPAGSTLSVRTQAPITVTVEK